MPGRSPLLLGPARLALPLFVPRPPWWGGDLQTLRNTLHYVPPDLTRYAGRRIHLPLTDGDCLWAFLNVPSGRDDKPLVILIHGLTGDENSRNIMTSAAWHLANGYRVLRLNLRGAGPSRGHCRSHYHAGRSADLHEVLTGLPDEYAARGVFLIGVSLGGNMLLKFMAEDPPAIVRGAISVCAPIDLKQAQRAIMQPRNAVYHWHLLRNMKRDALRSDPARNGPVLDGIRTVYDFDDRIVAPAGGFANAEDYYRQSSAAQRLDRIRRPTLLVHSADDPWVPAEMYLRRDFPATGAVTLALCPGGGHVGFHAADDPVPWHDRVAALFLNCCS